MKPLFAPLFALAVAFALVLPTSSAFAESQGSDYKGISDPFGDPANYEFAEDEKEDKEFFHLGRYIMIGVDVGVALFTGGLGKFIDPGFYVGGKLLYFFDRSIAFEIAAHFSNHRDLVNPKAGQLLDVDVTVIPITGGFRYYFDTRNAPKAIAIANPYLAFGGGAYLQQQNVIEAQGVNVQNGDTTAFGGYGGAGVEFTIYRRHVYLGLDLRYHLVFFPNESGDTLGGLVAEGDRAGDYFTSSVTLTYNF